MHEIQALIDEFAELADKLRLRDIEVAAATGLSAPTVRVIRKTREPPAQQRCIEGIRAFVVRNREARERSEVRLSA